MVAQGGQFGEGEKRRMAERYREDESGQGGGERENAGDPTGAEDTRLARGFEF